MRNRAGFQRCVVLIGLSLVGAFLPGRIAASSKEKRASAPDPVVSLSAAGLTNEEIVTALFLGEFETLDLKREELVFEAIFAGYLRAYATRCREHLPKDQTEMTRQECGTWRIWKNGYGVEVGNRECLHWETLGTGLWADPDLYAALEELRRVTAGDQVRQAWRMIARQENPLKMAQTAEMAAQDMVALLKTNGCTGAGVRRFEENLRLFALNEQGLRLKGAAQSLGPLVERDFASLVEDLVADQAQDWALNRFINGSVGDVTVTKRDAVGRPTKIEAGYLFNGFNGKSRGSLSITLFNGWPDCMYFFDAPSTCRSPNRKIVAAYAGGRLLSTESNQEASTQGKLPRQRNSETAPVATVPRAAEAPAPVVSVPVAGQTSTPRTRRHLRAANYIQGIKSACAEVLTGGEEREPELSYCYCLSAAAGSIPISDSDAQWFFENFGDAARSELETRYPTLARRFASCRAQMDASSEPEP
ncbi:MAG: hypothetical protein SF066_16285 [Thermoanaerobaculia bacterium]|nr:hypothetical protein [Thermoanaerobaculia bacterium]